MKNRIYKKVLLGLGFDCKDGHVRITKGKNFRLYGGSKETHGLMQEKAIKFNEHLGKKRKTLNNLSKKEFYDIAKKIGLHVPQNLKDK
ncbi:MAG: hypothetical protein JSV93_04020 [Candidatus Omnitrophota bacterium]|nr:MAG: hypothetical protein JSV93_04020 [Candidatus Omnitrophota bacterium]